MGYALEDVRVFRNQFDKFCAAPVRQSIAKRRERAPETDSEKQRGNLERNRRTFRPFLSSAPQTAQCPLVRVDILVPGGRVSAGKCHRAGGIASRRITKFDLVIIFSLKGPNWLFRSVSSLAV